MTLEIVCSSREDAEAAKRGGADRIELVSALNLGGLTPSYGTFQTTREVGLPIVAMVRPRTGGFCYGQAELDAMAVDVAFFAENDATVIFGALTREAKIDVAANRRLVNAAKGGECVFHRAFDVLADPLAGLEILIDLGFSRILTSGGKRTALEGAETIRRLIEAADGRIEILPAGGIRAGNVREVLQATGANQVHLAAQTSREDFSMGTSGLQFNGPAHAEAAYNAVDVEIVAAVRRELT